MGRSPPFCQLVLPNRFCLADGRIRQNVKLQGITPFEFMVKTALAVAKQWRWGEQKAKLLVGDLKAYNPCGHRKAVINGKPIRRCHAHMHTNAQPGINIDVAADPEANVAWAPPLAPQTQNIDDDLVGPGSISLDEIDAAFALLEREKEAVE
ncbi:hypothetical protein BDR06DRAFT_1017330 [Suillus hirtellus]|nr:hypothetical protein BDR06DRAFT_1017330 [Suillus hirtellus]